MSIFEPLTDVTVGESYIFVSVDILCKLNFHRGVLLFEDIERLQILHTGGNLQALVEHTFRESKGVPLVPRQYRDNHHRVFVDRPEVANFISDICHSQDIRKYYTLIGATTDPRDDLEHGKRLSAKLDEISLMMGECDDNEPVSDDVIEAFKRFLSEQEVRKSK